MPRYEVVALAVHGDPAKVGALGASWARWDPGARPDAIDGPQRSLVRPVVDYVQRAADGGRQVAVLIPEWSPSTIDTRSCRISGGLPPAAALRARTDVVVVSCRTG